MANLSNNEWSSGPVNSRNILKNAINFSKDKSDSHISVGSAGSAARVSNKILLNEDFRFSYGFLFSQESKKSSSEIIIGPVKYTYSLQDIKILESRAVNSPKATRSDKPILVDSGLTEQKAVISFLFSGEEDINIFARSLIAMFKVSPILSVKNEMLSDAWSAKSPALEKVLKTIITKKKSQLKEDRINNVYTNLRDAIRSGKFGADYLNELREDKNNPDREDLVSLARELYKYKIYSRYIPVALEELNVRTVPNMPNTLILSLTLNRIDISSSSEKGLLEYLGYLPESSSVRPQKAYWLKKWLYKLITEDSNYLPRINFSNDHDFSKLKFKFFSKTLTDILPLENIPYGKEGIVLSDKDASKVVGQSASISNHFAYQRIIGKFAPCAQHMGTSARYLTLDLEMHDSDKLFEKLSRFKEWSDYIMRSENILERVLGWEVKCIATKILGGSSSDPQKTRNGVYVNINSQVATTDIPHLKSLTLSMYETNTNFNEDYNLLLEDGGIEKSKLREFLLGDKDKKKGLMRLDESFRDLSAEQKSKSFAKVDNSIELSAHTTLWPSGNSVLLSSILPAINGIINRDTLRAVLVDRYFDKYNFLKSLVATPLASGVVRGKEDFSWWERIKSLRFTVPDIEDNDIGPARQAIIDIIDKGLFTTSPSEDDRKFLLDALAGATFGDDKAADSIVKFIAASKYKLSYDFKSALFNVLIKRKGPPSNIPKLYKKEGVLSAWQSLYYAYIFDRQKMPGYKQKIDDILNPRMNDKSWRASTYRDYWLPTYQELFGPSWTMFAPTYDDLGIIAPFDGRDRSTTNIDAQGLIASRPDDVVPPYIFFYHKKTKGEVKQQIKRNSDSFLDLGDARCLTWNIKSSRLSRLDDQDNREELKKIIESEDISALSNSTIDSLVDIIQDAYTDSETRLFDAARFNEDLDKIRDLVDSNSDEGFLKLYNKYHNPNSPFKLNLYFSTVADNPNSLGGYIHTRQQVSSLLGAAILRVMHDEQLRIKSTSTNVAYKSQHDQALVTEDGLTQTAFVRNLRDNTKKTSMSSIEQVPDTYSGMAKLWPAAKVYIIDRRGTDLIAEDVFFSSDSILSIDITQDKNDASLAVIKIADPLRYIQNTKFPTNNIVKGKETKFSNEDVVLSSKIGKSESFLKSKKIVQGRPIQIRLGYGSIPDNLPVTFTGRITEIEIGDVLTIVAQGWKAELINRQVNFYSSNRKSWGPKDLIIQAIQEADPDGIGYHYSEKDTEIILDRLESLPIEDQIKHAAAITKDTNLSKGTETLLTSAARYIGLDTLDIYDPDNILPGLDTRLKNIWYPDISKNISNFLGWRRWLGYTPDFINPYWIVPMQSAWNVLKEAERHTWTNIIQVAPYDSEATLFFGHPDQPYYFTKGKRDNIAAWKKYSSKIASRSLHTIANELLLGFLEQDEEKTNNFLFNTRGLSIFSAGGRVNNLQQLRSYIYRSSFGFDSKIASKFPVTADINNSSLPLEMYKYIEDTLGTSPEAIILFTMFGLSPRKINTLWGTNSTAKLDLMALLSSQGNAQSRTVYEERVLGNLTKIRDMLDPYLGGTIISKDTINSVIEQIEELSNSAIRSRYFITAITEQVEKINFGSNKKVRAHIRTLEKIYNDNLERTEFLGYSGFVLKNKDVERKLQRMIKELALYINKETEDIRSSEFNSRLPIIKDLSPNITVAELFDRYGYLIKLYTYYLGKYIRENSSISEKVKFSASDMSASSQAPFMKTFRAHHYIDSDTEIIENNIVATTAEMWNTVVINSPKDNPADTSVSDNSLFHRGTQVKTTVGWEYWPKPSQTKVIGLQFHPGISLSNKKVKVCTELNAVSEELKAKVACNRLAEGLKKMYRGHLIIRGRNIKPYDRIIINDKFNGIKGTIEVESVVHSFNPETGWTSNIIPEAISDANPGAAIIQTALIEAQTRKIYNTIDVITNGVMILTVARAFGGVSNLLKGSVKGVSTLLTTPVKGIGKAISSSVVTSANAIATKFNFSPIQALSFAAERFSPYAIQLGKAYLYSQSLKTGIHYTSQMLIASGWSNRGSDVAQLPVIISPLTHRGSPWTAGLEAEESLFSVPFWDTYYNLRDWVTSLNDYLTISFSNLQGR